MCVFVFPTPWQLREKFLPRHYRLGFAINRRSTAIEAGGMVRRSPSTGTVALRTLM
nr:hypothetical protein [Mycobacterium avium]